MDRRIALPGLFIVCYVLVQGCPGGYGSSVEDHKMTKKRRRIKDPSCQGMLVRLRGEFLFFLSFFLNTFWESGSPQKLEYGVSCGVIDAVVVR